MKSNVVIKRDRVITRLLRDENFLPQLSINHQLNLMDKIHEAKSVKQIEDLVEKAKKAKRQY